MDIIEGPIKVEYLKEAAQPKQPVGMDASPETLSDDAVRAALANAENEGKDPLSLKVSEMAQGQTPPVEPIAPKVPPKFLKPDGEVDVEKLKASTEQLDEAIKQKEQKLEVVSKSVEDYLREYQDKERKFKNLPNPDRVAASLPVQSLSQVPANPQQMSDEQIRQILQRDYQQDPVATTAQLIQIALEKGLEPIREKERHEKVRENLTDLAKKDPRILHPEVFSAINAKLESDPELWKLKNPHKAAWLDVKDELRLGDPTPGQAQPSKLPSPILGGGVPPSSPSSSAKSSQNILTSLNELNLRDKKQEEAGDAAIRAMLQGR